MELPLLSFIFLCMLFVAPSCSRYYTPPSVPRLTDLVPRVSTDQCFAKIFGASNIQLRNNGSSVDLTLDKVSGKFQIWILAFLLVQLCLVSFIIFSVHFWRCWFGLKKQISLWILQCFNQASIRSHFRGCSGFLCKLFSLAIFCLALPVW